MDFPRFTLVFALLAGLCASSARADDEADARVAEGVHHAAVALYARGYYRDAIDLFIEANRLRPSAALSFNVARCYEQLHDAKRAIVWYRDYLKRAKDKRDAVKVKQRIARLEKRLAERRAPHPSVRDTDVPADEPGVRALSSELRATRGAHAGPS